MVTSEPNFLQSPTLLAWFLFWIYLLFLCLGAYSLSRTFKKKGIVLGHLDDLFRFLTDLRIWSIRYRKTYTAIVSGVLVLMFLVLVYWSELLHATLYETAPTFTGLVDYVLWIGVFVVSGLQQGAYPNSLLGLVVSGVFPLVLIGSVFTIVQFTSERAHDVLIKRMAEGDIGSHRIVVFNYREQYDEFIHELLERSSAFIVVFAKEENLQDARSFIEGIDAADSKDYRTAIEQLSYSEDLLFEQYSVLESDELYVFPDAESRTDYENLRLITKLNQRVSDIESDPNRTADPPGTVWLSDSQKLTGISHSLEPTQFRDHLHAVSFQDDVRDLIRVNVGESLLELAEYFNFTEHTDVPPWIDGYGLVNYTFTSAPLTDEELDDLTDIRQFRERQLDRVDAVNKTQLASLKREVLDTVRSRLRADLEAHPPSTMGILFGLLADISGATVPIEFSSAYLNRQMETASATVQLTKAGDDVDQIGETTVSDGDIFVVNYNARIEEFVHSFGGRAADEGRHLTVYTSDAQVTPEADDNVTYAEYRSMTHLLEMLFSRTERSQRRLKPGDKVMLFLDDTIPNPRVNVLRILDAIDDRLDRDIGDVDHNDVFLSVESHADSSNEEYRYLAVDKVIPTHQTQQLFLHNLVQFRTSVPVSRMIQEGEMEYREAIDWAVDTAYYLRELRVDSVQEFREMDSTTDAVVGATLRDVVTEQRNYGKHDIIPFTTLTLRRNPDGDHAIGVEFAEPTRDQRIEADDFLLSFPKL